MPSIRRRVHIKFYYDTNEENIAQWGSLSDYLKITKQGLINAVKERHGLEFADRIKKVEIRITKPHKDCHCAKICKCKGQGNA